MTKKHFEATALIVSRISNPTTRATVAADFADLFASENPRFNRDLFMAACGL